MKNIFLLPTDQPSRLYKNIDGEIGLTNIVFRQEDGFSQNQHIYITSDEEISTDDYYICLINNNFYKAGHEDLLDKDRKHWKKIVLTTDPTLIEKGIQKIPNKFLEWFVKNPTCEFVPIITTIVSNSPIYKTNIGFESWRKEEIIPVQALSEPDGTGILSAMDVVEPFKEERIIIPQEEPKHTQVLSENGNQLFFDKEANIIKKEPKQETSEEVGKYFADNTDTTIVIERPGTLMSYSEEEVRKIAEWSFHFYKTNEFDDSELEEEWSKLLEEKFKKK
jgi:hypothetical protein